MENNPTPIIAESAVAAATVRLRKTLSGIIGSGTRVSIHRNSPRLNSPIASASTVGSDAPWSLAQVMPRIRATRLMVKTPAPAMSKPRGVYWDSSCGSAKIASARAITPMGMLIQKTHCHPH